MSLTYKDVYNDFLKYYPGLKDKVQRYEPTGVMGISEMIHALDRNGINATVGYDCLTKTHKLTACRGNNYIVKHFRTADPNVPNWTLNIERRMIIDSILCEFGRYEQEMRLKDLEPKKVYITTADYKPHTIFEELIKEKEQEFMKNIRWKVKQVNCERKTPYDGQEITAILEVDTLSPLDRMDLVKMQVELQNALDRMDPEKNKEFAQYIRSDVMATLELNRKLNPSTKLPKIKKVIFNDPATIVYWEDGSRTVVKTSKNDIFDPEKGLAMAIAKRTLGDQGNYYNEFRKWLPKEEPKHVVLVTNRAAEHIMGVLNDMAEEAKRAAKAMSAIDWEDFWHDR